MSINTDALRAIARKVLNTPSQATQADYDTLAVGVIGLTDYAQKFADDLIRQAAMETDRYGQVGAHEAITKARVAQDLLTLLGLTSDHVS